MSQRNVKLRICPSIKCQPMWNSRRTAKRWSPANRGSPSPGSNFGIPVRRREIKAKVSEISLPNCRLKKELQAEKCGYAFEELWDALNVAHQQAGGGDGSLA